MESEKTEIKKSQNADSKLRITFNKRRDGLMKKARELGILCDAQIAVIVFSSNGQLFEFSNSGMLQIIERYDRCLEKPGRPRVERQPEPAQGPKQENILKEEIEKLKLKQSQMMGKDLKGLSVKGLQELEHQLNEGLSLIKNRKEQMLMERLEQARMQEKKALRENHILRTKIVQLENLLASTKCHTRNNIDRFPVEKANMPVTGITAHPDKASLSVEVENEDSDINLCLGLSSGAFDKRKASEAAECSAGGAQKRRRTTHRSTERESG